jgi:hypothetical protein
MQALEISVSDHQAPEGAGETETELWRTIRHGWVLYLEGAGRHRLTLLPGDAARLAVLLREAQPPEAGTSAAVRAYRAATPAGEAGRGGRLDRLRAGLAQWVYDVLSP